MAKSTGLGRGLDSLIPVSLSVEDVASPGETIKQLAMGSIVQNPDQPRKSFDTQSLQELSVSIKKHGVIQPIVVTPAGKGKYRIVAGERRFRASQLASLQTIPAIVREHKELEELEIALVENVQRVDLSPLEQAVSIVRLHEQFSLSYKDIAAKLGKAETTISNIVRLLQLPKQAVDALQKNIISEGHARAILALKTDENAQKDLLNKIITQKLSVRASEEYVQSYKKSKDSVDSNTEDTALLSGVAKKFAVRTSIARKKNGSSGSVVVQFRNDTELQDIIQLLSSSK